MLTQTPPRSSTERDALHHLAEALQRLVPVRDFPEQAIKVSIFVPTPDDVRAAAARAGQLDVDVHVTDAGTVHTTAQIGFGAGTDTRSGVPDLRYAAVLAVLHITDAVDDEQGSDR